MDEERAAQGQEDGGGGERRRTLPAAPLRILAGTARLVRRGWGALRGVVGGDGSLFLDDVRAAFGHLNPRRLGLALIGLVVLGYLLSGIYTVRPGEVAVVRRFGRVVGPVVAEGLHYRLPWPLEREDIVNISEVRRESVGLTQAEPEHPLHRESPGKLQLLSGDTNILDYEAIVQYRISDPAAYLLNVNYPSYQLVRDAVRAAVARLSSATAVDAILTTERQGLQNAIRQQAQVLLDAYGSGVAVVSISLQKAYPPDEVAEAFRDVASAREDKSRAINEAEGYRNSVIPEARGQANRLLAEATSYARSQLDQSTGAAQGFRAILAQYRTNSKIYGEDVTRFRLYLETMEKILPRVQVYVVQRGERVNLRLLNGTRLVTIPPAPPASPGSPPTSPSPAP